MSRKRELETTVNRYRSAYKKHGDSPRSLLWNSKRSADIRFKNLLADIDIEGKSILDIGCGLGDIIPYLEQKSPNFKYTGIDLLPEFIERAQEKYPQHSFIAGDYKKIIRPADIILCSGALNANIDNVLEERKEAVELMFDYANEVLCFNIAGSFPQPENREDYIVYYVNSLEFIQYLFSLTSNIIVRHHYDPLDFTAILFKY